MRNLIKILVHDYTWIHLSLGMTGNLAFLVGSVLFLPQFEPYKTVGVWLFIIGSFLMAIGSLGQLLVTVWKKDKR